MHLLFQSTDESVNVLYHPPNWEGPILFSYREKVFFGKKRAAVRVETGDWSEKFALDAAGSTGLVECKANGVKYEVKSYQINFCNANYNFRILSIDCCSQHIDTQFAHQTNHIHAILCANQ